MTTCDVVPDLSHLSLGLGVQSMTLAAMIALKVLPPVDFAIHADTKHEAQKTYEYAQRWIPWLEARGLKVVVVSSDRTEIVRKDWGIGSIMIPAFSSRKTDGKKGQIRRQCTHDWKIMPMRRYIRTQLPPGRPRVGAVECIQGISLDEWTRMRTSDVKYIVNKYPLVNDLKMTRRDCIEWLERHDIEVPPKSACTFCPYHGLEQWRELKRAGGPDWEEAVAVDEEVRDMRELFHLYVHPSRLPLAEAITFPAKKDTDELEFDLTEAGCDGGVCFV